MNHSAAPTHANLALTAFNALTVLVGRDKAHDTILEAAGDFDPDTLQGTRDIQGNGDFPFVYMFSDGSAIIAETYEAEPRMATAQEASIIPTSDLC